MLSGAELQSRDPSMEQHQQVATHTSREDSPVISIFWQHATMLCSGTKN